MKTFNYNNIIFVEKKISNVSKTFEIKVILHGRALGGFVNVMLEAYVVFPQILTTYFFD